MRRVRAAVLTEKFCQSRKPPAEGREMHHDALVPGLALRVTSRGHKSWVLAARYPEHPGWSAKRALGDYCEATGPAADMARVRKLTQAIVGHPDPARLQQELIAALGGARTDAGAPAGRALTLAEARDRARRWLDMVSRGVDPRAEAAEHRARTRRQQVNTFAVMARAFAITRTSSVWQRRANAGGPWSASSSRCGPIARCRTSCVSRSRRLSATSPSARPTPRTTVSGICDAASPGPSATLGSPGQVAVRAPEAQGPDREKRARDVVLTPDELRRVWEATGPLGYPYCHVVRMMILTGRARRRSVVLAGLRSTWTRRSRSCPPRE